MVGLPADTLTRRGQQNGQITCYEKRTHHVLSTPALYGLDTANRVSDHPTALVVVHRRSALTGGPVMEQSAYSFDAKEVLKRSRRLGVARLAGRLRWLLLRRASGDRTVPLFGRLNALQVVARRFPRVLATKKFAPACVWLPVGPRNINGRIRCLAIHPGNPNVLYAGAA